MQEIWKDIPGYEGKYQISNLGNVMSLHFKRSPTNNRLLKPMSDNGYGYLKVMLRDNGSYKMKSIHRLVAEAFIPNPEEKPNVNHIDSNPKNNRVDNLEWCTQKENIDYGYRYGNIKPTCPMKDRTGCNNPLSKIVLQIDIKTGTVINEYFGLSEASRKTGLPSSNIYRSCVNNKKTCGGYNWRYKDE